MAPSDTESLIETIRDLALDLARLCPDAADKASHLVALVGELKVAAFDRGAIQDAIEAETVATDLSAAQVSTTTDAVLKAARDGSR